MTQLDRLVQVEIDRDIEPFATFEATTTIDLSRISPSLKSQTKTNLRRGWASAISGPSITLYQVLATAFDFPVFSIGRAERCILSWQETAEGQLQRVALQKHLEAMYSLSNPELVADANWKNYYCHYNFHDTDGHRNGWRQLVALRPRSLTIEGVVNALGVPSIFNIVPKAATLEAMLALDQGRKIILHTYMRK